MAASVAQSTSGSGNKDKDNTDAIVAGSVVGGIALVALAVVAATKLSANRSGSHGGQSTSTTFAKSAAPARATAQPATSTSPVEEMDGGAQDHMELETLEGMGSSSRRTSATLQPPTRPSDFTAVSLDATGTAHADGYGSQSTVD